MLICTTTNKAIDSLAEKLEREGYGDVMLAFGNKLKLGNATQRFLLESRIENHAIVVSAKRLEQLLDPERLPYSKSAISRIGKIFEETLKLAGNRYLPLMKCVEEFGLKIMDCVLSGAANVLSHFSMQLRRVRAAVTVHILKNARLFVCTASTAVRLPERFSRMCEEYMKEGIPPFVCQQVILDEAGAMVILNNLNRNVSSSQISLAPLFTDAKHYY